MRVVMLSPEVYPYAKTGGLADVLAALPRALAAAGVEVTVCMPGYRPALRAAGEPPVVLHVHEWQAALAPAFLRGTAELYPALARVRTVLTLHNPAYQGRFPPECWHLLNLDARYFVPEFLEFHAEINFLK